MNLSGIKIHHLTYLFFCIWASFSLGCASPPGKQIKEAEDALSNAHQKEAHLYAAEKYQMAQEQLSQAQKEMENERYRKAKSLAVKAKKDAEAAAALVEKQKLIFAEKAKKVISEAKENWDSFNHIELKKFFPELYSLASELLEEAESANSQGDYYHARQKAKEVLILSEEFSSLPEKKKKSLEKEMLETESLKAAQNKAKEIIDSASRDAAQMMDEAKKDAEKTIALAREKAKELWLKWLEKRFPSVYLVKKGETLADISAKKLVYGDPYLWPILYKANRDQIRDPHFIFAGQQLSIPRELTQEDLYVARRQAGAPPNYTLPLDAYDPSQYQKELNLE
jgi:nucleoid-associated protein YgaU